MVDGICYLIYAAKMSSYENDATRNYLITKELEKLLENKSVDF